MCRVPTRATATDAVPPAPPSPFPRPGTSRSDSPGMIPIRIYPPRTPRTTSSAARRRGARQAPAAAVGPRPTARTRIPARRAARSSTRSTRGYRTQSPGRPRSSPTSPWRPLSSPLPAPCEATRGSPRTPRAASHSRCTYGTHAARDPRRPARGSRADLPGPTPWVDSGRGPRPPTSAPSPYSPGSREPRRACARGRAGSRHRTRAP